MTPPPVEDLSLNASEGLQTPAARSSAEVAGRSVSRSIRSTSRSKKSTSVADNAYDEDDFEDDDEEKYESDEFDEEEDEESSSASASASGSVSGSASGTAPAKATVKSVASVGVQVALSDDFGIQCCPEDVDREAAMRRLPLGGLLPSQVAGLRTRMALDRLCGAVADPNQGYPWASSCSMALQQQRLVAATHGYGYPMCMPMYHHAAMMGSPALHAFYPPPVPHWGHGALFYS